LTVAFHFQFSNQDGWKCDVCRKSGLEKKRRCGWLGYEEQPRTAPVWARKDVSLTKCPKSYITAESRTLMEEFFARRRLGGMNFEELTGRQVDAFLLLEEAAAAEIRDGEHNSRYPF